MIGKLDRALCFKISKAGFARFLFPYYEIFEKGVFYGRNGQRYRAKGNALW